MSRKTPAPCDACQQLMPPRSSYTGACRMPHAVASNTSRHAACMRAGSHHASLRDRFQVFPRPDKGIMMFSNHMFDDGGTTAIAHAAAGATHSDKDPLREALGHVPGHRADKVQLQARSAAVDRDGGGPGDASVEPHSGRGNHGGRAPLVRSQPNAPGATS